MPVNCISLAKSGRRDWSKSAVIVALYFADKSFLLVQPAGREIAVSIATELLPSLDRTEILNPNLYCCADGIKNQFQMIVCRRHTLVILSTFSDIQQHIGHWNNVSRRIFRQKCEMKPRTKN